MHVHNSTDDDWGRVEYRPLLLTQPSSVSWLWSHTHWCPSQRPQEVMRVDGSANPTMPKKTQPSRGVGTLTDVRILPYKEANGPEKQQKGGCVLR